LNIGAFDSGKVVGYLNFRMQNPEHPWVQHLGQFGMFILKDYWGHGIGKKLLELQETHARSHGISRIEAMVRIKNDRGVKLYEHSGYKIEGTRRQAAKINGEVQDEYFIAKILDDPKLNWTPPTLITDRLILRPIGIGDAESIFAYAKNPNVCKYTLWEKHESVKDSFEYIKDYIFDYYSNGVPEPLGITLKENPQKVIGTVGCFWTSKSAKAMELAYAIGEDHWGKGLVAEASQAIMDYCFKEFSLKRIQARCKTENKGSSRVMEKVGMTYEGTLKSAIFHRNKFWDMHYYAKIREDFE
jgi:ribosomal-protein-alanine N-acetyltransferase